MTAMQRKALEQVKPSWNTDFEQAGAELSQAQQKLGL